MKTNRFVGATLVILGAAGLFDCAAGNDPTFETTPGEGGEGAGAGGDGGQGGQPVVSPCGQDCSAINSPPCYMSVCNEGAHPGPVGACVVVPSAAGGTCDDALFCTTNDTCDGMGQCLGGPPNDCGIAASACESVTCTEGTQSCSLTPVPNGGACVPDNLCEVGGTCTNGLCVGVPQDCFFEPVPNDCHISACNPQNGLCEPVADPTKDGQSCTDPTDLCTINKTCDTTGTCGGGSPKSCSHLTLGCDLGVCDTSNGQCITMTVMNGQLCDDLDGCTLGETCNNGTCAGGTLITACSGGQTADGCCPSACDATNDLDCAICVADWDDATLQGWTVTATCPSQNNWQPDTFQSQSGGHSLYYGNPSVHNFVCSAGAHSGTATSKIINLQPGTPDVTFWVWIETEGGTTYDQLGLWVMPQNVKVWDRNDFTQGAAGDTNGIFVQQTVSLTAYASQSIQLQFRFNTVDGVANSEEGVYIDSLTAQGNCP